MAAMDSDRRRHRLGGGRRGLRAGHDAAGRAHRDGEVYSPTFRFVLRFVTGYDGTMLTYLDGLEARMARERER